MYSKPLTSWKLLECVQGDASHAQVYLEAVGPPSSLRGVDSAPSPLVTSPVIIPFCHYTFAALPSSHVCLGIAVCASSWTDDIEPRDKHSLSLVELHVVMERHRCSGCPSTRPTSPVCHRGSWFCILLTFSRSPIIQSTPRRTAIFVYLTLAISFFAYARFCALVIKEITEYLGIACFTVRKKDAEGIWRDIRDIQQDGFSKRS